MKGKYVRAIKALERTAEYDPEARDIIERIKKEFGETEEEPEEEIVDKALALAASIYLNYKKSFTVSEVERDFKDLELSKTDIVSVVELLRELAAFEVSVKVDE